MIRNEVRGRPARIDRLDLGGVIIRHHPVMIVPTDGMTIPERPSENKTIQGILGWPLIRRFDIEIYPGNHRVWFEKIPLFPGSFIDGTLGTDVHVSGRIRIDYANGRYTLLD